jgi:hypothetical protein
MWTALLAESLAAPLTAATTTELDTTLTHNILARVSRSHTHHADGRRPLTAKARVRSQSSLYGICGGRHDTAGRLSPRAAVVPCQYPSTVLPKVCSDQFKGIRGYISVFSI